MNIMVVGGGGREHAIIKKLKENKDIKNIYALPGNGGISFDATCVDIKTSEIEKIVDFAVANNIDYAVVAPDDPLVLGCVDRLAEKGIPAFGPDAKAAIIEGSKVFSKNLMQKYNIPTAGYAVFDNAENAIAYVKQENTYPVVVKADGLALGKGVIIAENEIDTVDAINSIMQDKIFGASGNNIVIEEFLTGPEVSVLCFTDGKTLKPMVSSMDHKRALDGDNGLNTGGMGTISPNPYYTKSIADECMQTVFIPTIKAMETEGRLFKGCLYFGLMLTPNGVKVIEYNCRFGDPETQVVLPLLKSDLLSIMQSCTDGTLDKTDVEFHDGATACVVMASGGYPQKYPTGIEMFGMVQGNVENATVYHAGTKLENGKLFTAGGRVLGVTAQADTLQNAVAKAYKAVAKITFEGAHCRTDIGGKALSAKVERNG